MRRKCPESETRPRLWTARRALERWHPSCSPKGTVEKRMLRTGGGSWVLAGLLALGTSSAAVGGDAKTFKLEHPAARCGDAFSIEQKTSVVLAKKGGPERGHVETKSSYKVKV